MSVVRMLFDKSMSAEEISKMITEEIDKAKKEPSDKEEEKHNG